MTRRIASAAGLMASCLAVVVVVLAYRHYRDRVPDGMPPGTYTCVSETTHRPTGPIVRSIDDDSRVITVHRNGRLSTWRGDEATYELTREYTDYGPAYPKVAIRGIYGIEVRSTTLPASRPGNGYRPEGYRVLAGDRHGRPGETVPTIELGLTDTESVSCRRYG